MRKAEVKMYDRSAGLLWQDEEGYHFEYNADYLKGKDPEPGGTVKHD